MSRPHQRKERSGGGEDREKENEGALGPLMRKPYS